MAGMGEGHEVGHLYEESEKDCGLVPDLGGHSRFVDDVCRCNALVGIAGVWFPCDR